MSSWKIALRQALEMYVAEAQPGAGADLHLAQTPDRVVRAFAEYVSGYAEDPGLILRNGTFCEVRDQMIHIRDIRVTSMCAHHLQPIIGVAHFAYVPNKVIVGLSKLPRMIQVLGRRLQVQERLTDEIVDVFQREVEPGGCGVHIRAYHGCMMARGVREHGSITETTALRGVFKQGEARQEFMASLEHGGFQL